MLRYALIPSSQRVYSQSVWITTFSFGHSASRLDALFVPSQQCFLTYITLSNAELWIAITRRTSLPHVPISIKPSFTRLHSLSMVRNTLQKSPASAPSGYSSISQPVFYPSQPAQRPGSSNGSSVNSNSPQIAPLALGTSSTYLLGGIPNAQFFARRSSPSQTQTLNQAPGMVAARRSAAAPAYVYPSYARSSRTIPAGLDFPVLLDSGVYVARSLVDIPYRLFHVRVQTGGSVAALPYAALDRELLGSCTGEMDWFSVIDIGTWTRTLRRFRRSRTLSVDGVSLTLDRRRLLITTAVSGRRRISCRCSSARRSTKLTPNG